MIALSLAANGCAPASSLSYSRHLHAAHEPQHVNAAALAVAQQMYREPQQEEPLAAGALGDAQQVASGDR